MDAASIACSSARAGYRGRRGAGCLGRKPALRRHALPPPATDDALTVSGKVAGLGDETQINVSVTADVACINPGNNEPKAENKGATIAGDFPVQNGKDLFSVTGTGTTDPDCSPPMTLRYSNVVVTVSGDSFDPDLVFAFSGTF